MKLHQTEYVVFDVETTGLSPAMGDKIIELAAVKVKNLEIVGTFDELINPERKIPYEATRVNNITDEMVAQAPIASAVLPSFMEFIGGACLVGHNVKFDLEFLCCEFSKMGRKLLDETPALDTLKMSKKYVPHFRSHRLAFLAQSFGIKIGETHRALADVQLTMQVMKKLFQLAKEQGVNDFREIIKLFGVQKPNYKLEESQEFLFEF